jgi:hypothetical protein
MHMLVGLTDNLNNVFMETIIAILAAPATLTLVTLLAGLTAGYLYSKQRRDSQKDAADIILREIKSAEEMLPTAKRIIEDAKENGAPEKIQVMKNGSWPKLQHVLARRLPQDVMRSIGEFYDNCQLLDEALDAIDQSFYMNAHEVRASQFRVVADLLEARVKATKPNPNNDPGILTANEKVEQDYLRKTADFKSNWPALNVTYTPVRVASDAEKYLELLPRNLSQTRVGDKLRRVSAGSWRRLLDRKEV